MSMKTLYTRLNPHIDHRVIIKSYEGGDVPFQLMYGPDTYQHPCVALECRTCEVTIIDTDLYEVEALP